jgi:MFS family permease
MFIRDQLRRTTDVYHEYPKSFWMLVVVNFIDRLGGSLLYPFFALYITHKFNVGMTEVGVLFAVFSIGSFAGSFIGGALTDHLGRKGMIIFSLVSTSLSNVIMGLVNSLSAFFVIATVVGIFTDSGSPAYQSIVADLLPEQKRAQGFGIIRVVFNAAAVIGPVIGGFIAQRSYLALFIADAVISLIAAAVVVFGIQETKPEARPEAAAESTAQTFGGYTNVLRDRAFMTFLVVCTMAWLTYVNMSTTLGVYLRDVHGIPEAGYGWILSLNAGLVVLFQFPITRRIEKRPPMLMMAFGSAFLAAGFAMYGFTSTYILFLLAMAIITVGEMIAVPVSNALVASFAPEDMRGRYNAIFDISWGVPFAVGPYLAGLVMDNLNPNWLWYLCGVTGGLATLGFLFLHWRIHPASIPSEEAAA